MTLDLFLAIQVSILPIQMLLFLGIYNERKRQEYMFRAAVVRLAHRSAGK